MAARARSTCSAAVHFGSAVPLATLTGASLQIHVAHRKRARMVAVDIHAAPQSQPATLGGLKGICPIIELIHAQSSVSIARPTMRRLPAICTIGHLTICGWSRSAYSARLSRISRTTGAMRWCERT